MGASSGSGEGPVQRPSRYVEIERWLRGRVLRQEPGTALPSETELAEQFGVSRMTARQAVQNLAHEGLVQRRRGAGTYVAPQPLHRRGGILLSFTEDMHRRGIAPSSRLLQAGLRPADAAEAASLDIAEGRRVVAVSRIRLGDGVPLALEHVVLPTSCAAVLGYDLETGSIHEALIKAGRVPSRARSWITARVARTQEAKLLEISPRAPLLVERRVIHDAVGAPLEHTETAYVAERYVIDTMSVAEAAPLRAPVVTPAAGA